jgi:hypothetical protein
MDSFTLLLNQESEYEVDFNKFERTPKYLFELPYKPPFYGKKGQFYSTCKIIKIKGEKYLPQVTIYTNKNLYGHYPYLYIRFSAPKIIFGDNYNELTDKDFKKLVKKLVKILRKMGVKTSVKVIINARVVEAHFAKNFIFPDEQTLYDFFYLLEKTKFPYLK